MPEWGNVSDEVEHVEQFEVNSRFASLNDSELQEIVGQKQKGQKEKVDKSGCSAFCTFCSFIRQEVLNRDINACALKINKLCFNFESQRTFYSHMINK